MTSFSTGVIACKQLSGSGRPRHVMGAELTTIKEVSTAVKIFMVPLYGQYDAF
jgi:hypothetical protein